MIYIKTPKTESPSPGIMLSNPRLNQFPPPPVSLRTHTNLYLAAADTDMRRHDRQNAQELPKSNVTLFGRVMTGAKLVLRCLQYIRYIYEYPYGYSPGPWTDDGQSP